MGTLGDTAARDVGSRLVEMFARESIIPAFLRVLGGFFPSWREILPFSSPQQTSTLDV
jgi:hypothetical protein